MITPNQEFEGLLREMIRVRCHMTNLLKLPSILKFGIIKYIVAWYLVDVSDSTLTLNKDQHYQTMRILLSSIK